MRRRADVDMPLASLTSHGSNRIPSRTPPASLLPTAAPLPTRANRDDSSSSGVHTRRQATDASSAHALRGPLAPSRRDGFSRGVGNSREPRDPDLVDIPGVGYLNRRQLRRLQDTINGRSTSIDVTDLPDLTNLSRYQLRVLESTLDQLPDAEEEQESSTPTPNLRRRSRTHQHGTGQDYFSDDRWREAPNGQVEDLPYEQILMDSNSEVAPMQRVRNQNAHGHDASTKSNAKRWHVDETVLNTLTEFTGDAPLENECAICFQMLKGDRVPLPCTKRGCASWFHSACIRPWLERNPSCPLCRADMQQLVRPVTPKPTSTDTDTLLLAALGRHHTIALQQPISRAYAFLLHHRDRAPQSALAGGNSFFATIERLATQVLPPQEMVAPEIPSSGADSSRQVVPAPSPTNSVANSGQLPRGTGAAERAARRVAASASSTHIFNEAVFGDTTGRPNRALRPMAAMSEVPVSGVGTGNVRASSMPQLRGTEGRRWRQNM